jgi:tetratricopeptide (TPR) repeat protein
MMIESYDYALSVTHQATLLEPDDELFQLQMGRIWKQRGYYDKAMPYYETAMRLNPLSVEAAMGYIDTKLSMEDDQADLRGGLEFLERYVALEPRNEDLIYRIGKLRDAIERRLTRSPDFGTLSVAPELAPSSEPPEDDPHAGHDHD